MSTNLLEANYERWLDDPTGVEPAWAAFFEGFELGTAQLEELGGAEQNGAGSAKAVEGDDERPDSLPDSVHSAFRGRLVSLVYNYRTLGHTQAHINPLDESPKRNPRLDPLKFGFGEKEMGRRVSTQFFRDKEATFLVPLGIKSHLEYWGVASKNIVELDWWAEHVFCLLYTSPSPRDS